MLAFFFLCQLNFKDMFTSLGLFKAAKYNHFHIDQKIAVGLELKNKVIRKK